MICDSIQLYSKEEILEFLEWWKSSCCKNPEEDKPPFTFSECQRELLRLENLEVVLGDLL